MAKRKMFGISEALGRGLSETVGIVENNNGIFRNAVIPLSRIELDPDNPRRLLMTFAELPQGPQKEDPQFQLKLAEFELLQGLAKTIQQKGLIQPIAVYKLNEKYRVVAGNRRCLASVIAGKSDVEARIFNERPSRFELKLVQLIENTAREDLNLSERLGNIEDLIDEYKKEQQLEKISATILRELTGLSLTQVKYYLYALNAPTDVKAAIKFGKIQSLDKAVLIATITNAEIRQQAMERCIAGTTLADLRKFIEQNKNSKQLTKQKLASNRGRAATQVNMGTTQNPQVVKLLVESLLEQPQYRKYQSSFAKIEWSHYQQATQAFKRLIQILEKAYE